MMDHTPLDPATLSQAAQRALGPGPGRMMVARGMMPLPPADNLAVLYQLSLDGDQSLVQAAKVTASGLPEKLLAGALANPALDARIIDYFGLMALDKASVFDAVVLNATTSDLTIAAMAGRCGQREVDLIATNEQRLLRYPEIIGAMYMNRRARMSTIDRVVELAVRNNVRVPGLAAWDEIARSLQGGAPAAPEDDAAFAAAVSTDENEKLTTGSGEDVPEEAAEEVASVNEGGLRIVGRITGAETRADGTYISVNVGLDNGINKTWRAEIIKSNDGYDKSVHGGEVLIVRCESTALLAKTRLAQDQLAQTPWVRFFPAKEETVSSQIRRATIGNAQDRDELVRSPLRLVAMAAIKSPSVKDVEVARWAGNQNLLEDVIKYIAGRREWTKMYGIKVSLCRNPKTPLPDSARLLPSLRERELTNLSKSKAVSSALVANARKLLMARRTRS